MKKENRLALDSDFNSIQSIDEQVIGTVLERSEIIAEAIKEKRCKVIVANSQVLGFSVWSPGSFRERDFLSLIVVDPLCRRHGLASALLSDFQNSSEGAECWTSTNASNLSMRSLLKKLGWEDSGYLEELDPGDPDLFFLWSKSER